MTIMDITKRNVMGNRSTKKSRHVDFRKLEEIPISEDGSINRSIGEPCLKVVCISDTHTHMDKIKHIPDGDVLIHAGDFTNYGMKNELIRFNEQMGYLPHKHKLVIPGNHERGLDDTQNTKEGTRKGYELLTNMTYLVDQQVEIEGVSFYGTPWGNFHGYPFCRNTDERREIYAKIPINTDVLITHSPPKGVMDGMNWGCEEMRIAIQERIKPQFHIFGHVHEGFGVLTDGLTTFINAAQEEPPYCEDYKEHKPIVFYIPIPNRNE